MQKISIFIPVYRESELLGASLKSLIRDPYKNKEIFVVMDEPTKKSLELTKRYKNKVKFILNEKRKGKVNALNEAVKLSKGNVFLFLDADVKMPENSKKILRIVMNEIDGVDILEIKKRIIRDSLVSRIVSYDYLSFNFVNWMFSKTLKRCLGINGAAFAIKRDVFQELGNFKKVVSEDLNIGTEAFLKNKRFKYVDDIEVLNKLSPSWRDWFKQRKRWGLGAALWFKDYYKDLIKGVIRHPQILVPSVFFIFPSLVLFLSSFFISTTLVEKLLTVFLMFASTKVSILIPFIFFTSTGVLLIKNIILSFMSFGIFSILFYFIAKKLHYEFNPLEFAIYFFFYCSIWLLIVTVSFIRVLVFSKYSLADWKV